MAKTETVQKAREEYFRILKHSPSVAHDIKHWADFAESHAADENKELREENRRLREALESRNTCVVCRCSLMPEEELPHCEDCHVTDEIRELWEDEIELRGTAKKGGG